MMPSLIKSLQPQKWTTTAKVKALAGAECAACAEYAACAGHKVAVSAAHSVEVLGGVVLAEDVEAIVAVEAAGAETTETVITG